VAAHILRRLPCAAIPYRQKYRSVRRLDKTRAKMQAARTSRTHFEHLTEAFKLRAVLGQPPDAKGRALAAARLGRCRTE
jgi:hypothetical protein